MSNFLLGILIALIVYPFWARLLGELALFLWRKQLRREMRELESLSDRLLGSPNVGVVPGQRSSEQKNRMMN